MTCRSRPIDKTNAFYGVLQEGGFEKHAQISAGDKDFIPVFLKVCQFSTTDVFKLVVSTGQESAAIYSEDEESTLLDNDSVVEIIREEQWLEEVFGT